MDSLFTDKNIREIWLGSGIQKSYWMICGGIPIILPRYLALAWLKEKKVQVKNNDSGELEFTKTK